jgi:hypothetical protein
MVTRLTGKKCPARRKPPLKKRIGPSRLNRAAHFSSADCNHVRELDELLGSIEFLSPLPSGQHSQAILRAFVTVFRVARGFFRVAVAVFLFLGVASIRDGNSSSGCFVVRWWPWRNGWMRAASASVRNRSPFLFWRSSSRYAGIVLGCFWLLRRVCEASC